MKTIIKLYTIFNPHDEITRYKTQVLLSEIDFLFKNSKYKIELSNCIKDCDLIFLDILTTSYSHDEYNESVIKHLNIKDNINYKTKNFIGVSYHEIHPIDVFEKKINFIENELGIDRQRIFLIDTSLTNRNNYNDDI